MKLSEMHIDYLLKMNGWCDRVKMNALYNLVIQAYKEKPDSFISLELGIFAGRSILPMAIAHKDLKTGYSFGIDAWDNVAPQEGSNSPENNEWWGSLNMDSIHKEFLTAIDFFYLKDYCKFEKCKTDSCKTPFEDESLAVVHQDGNHNTETIIKELEIWLPKLRMGGYWVVDDTSWAETKEAYAKLPSFRLELMEDFGTWQIWKKV